MPLSSKVSIIIPVYNGSDYLREAIDSALGQTYENIEILVINDGSNDAGMTEAIARSYGDKIIYLCKENGGVASALNLGIEKMTGDFFSWLSHDDLYSPEKVEAEIAVFQNHPGKDILVYCDSESIDSEGNFLGSIEIRERYKKNPVLLILSSYLHGCSLLIPREAFMRAGLFSKALRNTQDVDMWMRFAAAGYDFIYLPKVLVKGRIHLNQTTITTHARHLEERRNFYQGALAVIDNRYLQKYRFDILAILYRKNHPEAIRDLQELMKGELPLLAGIIFSLAAGFLLAVLDLRNSLRGSPIYNYLKGRKKNKFSAPEI